MWNFTYPVLLVASYFGTRWWGLGKTILAFSAGTGFLKKFRFGKSPETGRLWQRFETSYCRLPFPIQCLDQFIVLWSLLNFHNYPSKLKIGIGLAPLFSHAWVEFGENVFVDAVFRPDLTVAAEYPAVA